MVSLIIVLLTIAVSVYVFYNRQWFDRFSLQTFKIIHTKQWYRVFSHVLVHADWSHLLVNMYVLFVFGKVCEAYFNLYFDGKSTLYFLLLYVSSVIVSSIYSIIKFKNNKYYSAVGASGAVMAVVFTSIFFDPWNKLWFFGVIPIPGIVFGALYLAYSYYMGKKNIDNIGHDAHFTGALFGMVFPILIDFSLLKVFLEKLF
jgi:membrane associated rhomboid family serine protease